jgi:hypothetical protein
MKRRYVCIEKNQVVSGSNEKGEWELRVSLVTQALEVRVRATVKALGAV